MCQQKLIGSRLDCGTDMEVHHLEMPSERVCAAGKDASRWPFAVSHFRNCWNCKGSHWLKSILLGVAHIHWHTETQQFHSNADQVQRAILALEHEKVSRGCPQGRLKVPFSCAHICFLPSSQALILISPWRTICTLHSISASQFTSLGIQPVVACMCMISTERLWSEFIPSSYRWSNAACVNFVESLKPDTSQWCRVRDAGVPGESCSSGRTFPT